MIARSWWLLVLWWGVVGVEGASNLVLIYADDLGYGDVGVYNPDHGKIPTPHLDALAAEGMRFTDAHSSSGVCSPSRYTLLTGRYHWRSRLQRGIVNLWGPPVIAEDRMTLGGLMQGAGYETVCIGKWHLGWDWPIEEGERAYFSSGGYGGKKDLEATEAHREAWAAVFQRELGGGPVARGFHGYFGTDVPNWPPFCYIENGRTVGIPSEYLPARHFARNQASQQGPALEGWELEPILPELGKRAEAFLRSRAGGGEKAPFFLYLPLTSPHTPLAVNAGWRGRSGLGLYGDFVMETDVLVGGVLEALEDAGLEEETLVIFTSDNGCAPYVGAAEMEAAGHYPSGPLRGYKSDVWEGGHRVPFMVRWPGVVKPGTVSRALVHQADLLATMAEVLDVRLPEDAGEDSVSFLPVLRGDKESTRTTAVSCSAQGLPGIREGHWKLIPGSGSGGWSAGGDGVGVQLYDLADDLGEEKNLALEQPERVRAMAALLEDMIQRGRSTPGIEQENDVEVKRYEISWSKDGDEDEAKTQEE